MVYYLVTLVVFYIFSHPLLMSFLLFTSFSHPLRVSFLVYILSFSLVKSEFSFGLLISYLFRTKGELHTGVINLTVSRSLPCVTRSLKVLVYLPALPRFFWNAGEIDSISPYLQTVATSSSHLFTRGAW